MDIRYEGHSEVVYKRSPPPVIDLEQQLLQSKRECQLLDAGGMRFKSEHLESSSSVLGRYVCCSVLQCVKVCCSVLQYVAMCKYHRYLCNTHLHFVLKSAVTNSKSLNRSKIFL